MYDKELWRSNGSHRAVEMKLFCAEKNLAFMEDVVEIEAKMTSVAVNYG